MTLVPVVAAAGAGGAVARFLVDRIVVARRPGPWPLATLLINATGALALGLLTGAAAAHDLSAGTLTVAGTGFCGGYTTFSTFTVENVRLLHAGRLGMPLAYTAASLLLGLGLAAVGLAVL